MVCPCLRSVTTVITVKDAIQRDKTGPINNEFDKARIENFQNTKKYTCQIFFQEDKVANIGGKNFQHYYKTTKFKDKKLRGFTEKLENLYNKISHTNVPPQEQANNQLHTTSEEISRMHENHLQIIEMLIDLDEFCKCIEYQNLPYCKTLSSYFDNSPLRETFIKTKNKYRSITPNQVIRFTSIQHKDKFLGCHVSPINAIFSAGIYKRFAKCTDNTQKYRQRIEIANPQNENFVFGNTYAIQNVYTQRYLQNSDNNKRLPWNSTTITDNERFMFVNVPENGSDNKRQIRNNDYIKILLYKTENNIPLYVHRTNYADSRNLAIITKVYVHNEGQNI
jgi:hypothetical protein